MTELEEKLERAVNKVMTKFEGGLEIKKLDSVKSIEAEIKMLQSKLEFYKELEKTKTPVEEAYKRVYGAYPMTDLGDGCWENFQAGYAAAQEDYKVGEYQKAETPKPPEKLYDLIEEWWADVFTTSVEMEVCIDNLVNSISEWLPKEQSAAGSQNVYVECAVDGYNDCLNDIKRKLR